MELVRPAEILRIIRHGCTIVDKLMIIAVAILLSDVILTAVRSGISEANRRQQVKTELQMFQAIVTRLDEIKYDLKGMRNARK